MGSSSSTPAVNEKGFYLVPCEIKMKSDFPSTPVTVYDTIFADFDKFGDRVAFIDTIGEAERSITFAEVRTRVRAVAKGMLAKKWTRGDVIAVYAPNCIDWITVVHAAMAIGVTVAPINPTYETREVMHHLNEATEGSSQVKAIFTIPVAPFKDHAEAAAQQYATEHSVENPLPVTFLLGGSLDAFIEEGKDVSEDDVDAATKAIDPVNDVALLPASSGTTGPPKCVELTHCTIATNIKQSNALLGMDESDVTVAFLPFFHVFGFAMFVGFCLMGGTKTIILAKFDPKKYMELIAREKPTTLHVVPPVANALAKLAPEGLLDSVKGILCAAAPLSKEQEDSLQAKLKNGVIHQAYGMTELSPVATVCPIITEENRKDALARTGTVGILVPGTDARLIAVEGEEDPTRGLLQIRGPQVMRGYRKREAQTKATVLEGGWLDTGDVAVVDQAGYFWIVDRVKELIKVKGFQVAPAELEGLLSGHESIRECCVIGVPHDKAGEVPKAFVSLKPGLEVSAEDLYKQLDEHLTTLGTSDFKRLKGGLEIVADVKKTASGKLLRKDYRTMEKERREKSEAFLMGDPVQVRDSDAQTWKSATVTRVEGAILAKLDGCQEGYRWKQIHSAKAPPASCYVPER